MEEFRDAPDRVLVQVSGTPRDLQLSYTADSLFVRSKSEEEPFLSIPQLYGTILADRTTLKTNGDGASCTITLYKSTPGQPWPQLSVANEREPGDAASQPAGDALSARESVKRLLCAAREGDVGELQLAEKAFEGSNLGDVKDAHGHNALHFAAAAGRLDACRHLVDVCAINPNAADEEGETALTMVIGDSMHGDSRTARLAVARLLMNAGASIEPATCTSAGPLHRAAAAGDVELVRELLDRGANINRQSDTGPPLLWATSAERTAAVEALLAAGADPSLQGHDGVTALIMAAATKNAGILEALIKSKADVNLAATKGVTPLHVAAESGSPDLVSLLLEAGADANAADSDGHKPIIAGAASGQREIVEMLMPRTEPLPDVQWSVDALMEHAAELYSAAQQSQEAHEHHGHAHSHQCCSGHHHAHDEMPEEVPIPEARQPNEVEAQLHRRRGDEAFVRGDYAGAAEAYTHALHHNTRDATTWCNRSAAFLRLEDPAMALTDARCARTLKRDYAKAWYREGSAAEKLGSWEEAAQAYFEGCRADPANQDLAQAFHRAVMEGRKEYQTARQRNSA